LVFDHASIVGGFAAAGYRTVCIGGTGFFNPSFPLGTVLSGHFQEAHWHAGLGVASRNSTDQQVAQALACIENLPHYQRLFLFINISALHQPNAFYLGQAEDDIHSHAAALRAVDAALPPLIEALIARAPLLNVWCSDHGTTYGEDGYHGHRLAHPAVWTVPYAEFVL
jgi:hypothetical protein